MCLFTSARTVAIVFARSAGSEAMYCAGVLTFDGGFMARRLFERSVPPQKPFIRHFGTASKQFTLKRMSMPALQIPPHRPHSFAETNLPNLQVISHEFLH